LLDPGFWVEYEVMTLNIQEMSRQEKLQALQALWENLVQEDEAIDSPSWHGDALKETEERMKSGNECTWDWETAKDELKRRAQ